MEGKRKMEEKELFERARALAEDIVKISYLDRFDLPELLHSYVDPLLLFSVVNVIESCSSTIKIGKYSVSDQEAHVTGLTYRLLEMNLMIDEGIEYQCSRDPNYVKDFDENKVPLALALLAYYNKPEKNVEFEIEQFNYFYLIALIELIDFQSEIYKCYFPEDIILSDSEASAEKATLDLNTLLYKALSAQNLGSEAIWQVADKVHEGVVKDSKEKYFKEAYEKFQRQAQLHGAKAHDSNPRFSEALQDGLRVIQEFDTSNDLLKKDGLALLRIFLSVKASQYQLSFEKNNGVVYSTGTIETKLGKAGINIPESWSILTGKTLGKRNAATARIKSILQSELE